MRDSSRTDSTQTFYDTPGQSHSSWSLTWRIFGLAIPRMHRLIFNIRTQDQRHTVLGKDSKFVFWCTRPYQHMYIYIYIYIYIYQAGKLLYPLTLECLLKDN